MTIESKSSAAPVQCQIEPESAFHLLRRLDPKLAGALDSLVKSGKTEVERKTYTDLVTLSCVHLAQSLTVAQASKNKAPTKINARPKTAPREATAAESTPPAVEQVTKETALVEAQSSEVETDAAEPPAAQPPKKRASKKKTDGEANPDSAERTPAPVDEIPPGSRFK